MTGQKPGLRDRGQGFIDVFEQKDPITTTASQGTRVRRAPDRLLVPEWGRLFAAVPNRGTQASEVLVYQAN